MARRVVPYTLLLWVLLAASLLVVGGLLYLLVS